MNLFEPILWKKCGCGIKQLRFRAQCATMSHTTQRINLNPPYTYLLYLAYAPIFGEWRGGVFQCDGRFSPARYIVLSSKKYGMRIYHASGPEARQSEARRFFQPWQGWGSLGREMALPFFSLDLVPRAGGFGH